MPVISRIGLKRHVRVVFVPQVASVQMFVAKGLAQTCAHGWERNNVYENVVKPTRCQLILMQLKLNEICNEMYTLIAIGWSIVAN